MFGIPISDGRGRIRGQLIWGLSLVGEHHIGLQIAKRLEEGEPGVPFHELDLMVIDSFEPDAAAIRRASPEIVDLWHDHLLSVTRSPFPQIGFLSMASSSSFPN